MARKNLLEVSDHKLDELSADNSILNHRPLAGISTHRVPLPVGGISKSLQNITAKIEKAEEAERRLSEGFVVVELDPALVHPSFVSDRLSITSESQEVLIEQIRDHGQQVPILVRPYPGRPGEYQVAYGHRRLSAVRALGAKVRAVVRDLTDAQLVVSQGQENNARTDLSYIERAYFARKLEEGGFDRTVIMAALGVDKAALSKMISLTKRLPPKLIEAIGAAPATGRRRWEELADLLSDAPAVQRAAQIAVDIEFNQLDSDRRFLKLITMLAEPTRLSPAQSWSTDDGISAVSIKSTERKLQLVFDNQRLPAFGEFVRGRLGDLYEEFKLRNGD